MSRIISDTPSLTFDGASHRYKLDGRPVPSVTEVISSLLPGWQADPWYLNRGACLHHGCALHDKSVLDWSSVSPEIAGRVRAWQRFRDEFPAETLMIETPLASRRYLFAGTPDRLFQRDGYLFVCDLKSSLESQVDLQLGAYSLLVEEETRIKPKKAVAVELRDDETYRCRWLDQHQLRRAEQVFLACLSVVGWARHNKVQL